MYFKVLSVELARCMSVLQVVVSANIFPQIYLLLKDSEPMVRKNSTLVICEVCKHAPNLANVISKTKGIPPLVDNISDTHNAERLPGTPIYSHDLILCN